MSLPSLSPLLIALLSTLAWAAPALRGDVAITPTLKINVELHEQPKAENQIDFFVDGKPHQVETAVGDRFTAFQKDGQSQYFHSADLFNDGKREVFVRLIMIPMGVIRVFRWNEALQKMERMTFGTKKEDGLPVPVLAPVILEEKGDLTYLVKRKGGKTAKFRLHWNGSDYELPAKEVH